jgi:LuxR family maltose regulon positive regulatory protein
MQEVMHALSLAEAGGYITCFTLEGPPMAELIRKTVKLKECKYPFSFEYAKRILDAFPDITTVSHPTLLDDLSDRELDVLRCLAQGMRNQEIADSLYISLNTVKTHLKRIHSKLDVKSRTEAAVRGRELGLL